MLEELWKQSSNERTKKETKEICEEGRKVGSKDKKLGRRRIDLRSDKTLKPRLLEGKTQEMFSVGLSNGFFYVRRRIFEWPDIRKCYSVRIS